MNAVFARLVLILGLLAIVGCSARAPAPIPTVAPTPTALPTPTLAPFSPIDAAQQAAQLGRGINFGNMLEAPSEGAWGLTLEEDYFDLAKDAGFKTIRLPVRWSAYTGAHAPYTIDATFFERVDWAIQQALQRDLHIIVNVHHYAELMTNSVKERPRFAAMWKQIADRYKDYPNQVLFELYNEPNAMSDNIWNEIAAETLGVVRASNPTRNVLIGGIDHNSVNGLLELELPDNDPHLIATFHYYLPFDFTHQGADWVPASEPWLGKTWGTSGDKANVKYDIDRAANWGEQHGRPVYLGEFGAYREADMDSRVAWTSFVARQAERRNMGWAYWDFAADFAVYDPAKQEWIEPLKVALFPE